MNASRIELAFITELALPAVATPVRQTNMPVHDDKFYLAISIAINCGNQDFSNMFSTQDVLKCNFLLFITGHILSTYIYFTVLLDGKCIGLKNITKSDLFVYKGKNKNHALILCTISSFCCWCCKEKYSQILKTGFVTPSSAVKCKEVCDKPVVSLCSDRFQVSSF